MISSYLFLRLWQIIGTRPSGTVQRATVITVTDNDNVYTPEKTTETPADQREPQEQWSDALQAIRKHNPAFTWDQFQTGARAVYRAVIEAFTAGDMSPVQNLTAQPMLDMLAQEIEKRINAKETLTTDIKLLESEILDAQVLESNHGPIARVKVSLISDQVMVVRNGAGEIIDNLNMLPHRLTDVWEFEKELQKPTPEWILIHTYEHN